MISLNRKDIDRLIISVVVAVLIHVLLFFVLPFVIKFGGEKIPQYSGPVFVNLEEVPALGKTVVREETSKKKVVETPPVVEKYPVKNPVKRPVEPVKEGGKVSPAVRGTGRSRSAKSAPVEPVNPVSSGTVEERLPSPSYRGVESKSSAPGSEITPKPSFPRSGSVYENKNPVQTAGTREKKSGNSENLALSESIYSKLDRLLKEKNRESSLRAGSSGVNNGKVAAGEIASAEGGTKSIESPSGGKSGEVSGPNIQWEEVSQKRIPISMPLPKIPKWVGKQGLTLKVTVSFELLPEGIIKSLKVVDSSGYSDVDSAVVEALRHWRFEAVSGTKVVRGKITYIIKPK